MPKINAIKIRNICLINNKEKKLSTDSTLKYELIFQNSSVMLKRSRSFRDLFDLDFCSSRNLEIKRPDNMIVLEIESQQDQDGRNKKSKVTELIKEEHSASCLVSCPLYSGNCSSCEVCNITAVIMQDCNRLGVGMVIK